LDRRLRSALLSALLAATVVGCSDGGDAPTLATAPSAATAAPSGARSGVPSSAPSLLTVFAAASLKKAFTELGSVYPATHPGTRLTFSFDASSALEAQIEQGAPADVFASADVKNPQKLVDGGFASGRVTHFAANRLAVIVPTGNPAGIASPLDLARAGVKVVAAGDDVPITKYADRLLDDLAGQPGYPADFAARVRANIVSREDNVSAVVAKIELGEGDAAIVYVTDAKGTAKVTSLAVPDAANVPAIYGAVVVRASRNAAAGAAFVAWLAGPDGQAILARFGFLAPP
jgi:molybdate transport system substrate-binding protein